MNPPDRRLDRVPRALLVSLRDPDDPMARHEHDCFVEHAGLPAEALHVAHMAEARPSLDGYELVFFGGSGAYSVLDDVAWIRETVDVMLEVIDRRIPAYASCFGFQGVSMALGGRVVQDKARAEMGAVQLRRTAAAVHDPIFSGLPGEFWAQQGHKDHVVELPPGVTLLAVGDVSENQAFKVDRAPFWASQFHPELTARTTVDRFVYYADHYLPPEEREPILRKLRAGTDSPEVGALLARITRYAAER